MEQLRINDVCKNDDNDDVTWNNNNNTNNNEEQAAKATVGSLAEKPRLDWEKSWDVFRVRSNRSNLVKSKKEYGKIKGQIESKNARHAITEMWHQIDAEVVRDADTYYRLGDGKVLAAADAMSASVVKCIRVFVSSTFTDFFNERELLVKKVFPELREWCARRNLDLIESDLRWGVPADSTSDDTILTCLNEIDRCYADNERPFFVGMLADKYGWVPDMDQLDARLRQTYKWLPNVSITFMEFLHGAIRSRNPNACFFVRSSDSIARVPVEYRDKFVETNTFSRIQLKMEKEHLRRHFPHTTFDYTCKYGGIDESTGRKKVKLVDFTGFTERALDFLKQAISRQYPNLTEPEATPSEEDETGSTEDDNDEEIASVKLKRELDYQRMYLNERLFFHVERRPEIDAIVHFVSRRDFDHTVIQLEDPSNHRPVNRSLLILGENGSGKTSMLAFLANHLTQFGFQVFYHFYDASTHSQFAHQMCLSFLDFFSKLVNLSKAAERFKDYALVADDQASYVAFDEACQILSTHATHYKIVIILDNLEKMSEYDAKLLNIPRRMSPNISVLVACDSEAAGLVRDVTGDETWHRLTLGHMSEETTRSFVHQYLKKYNKRLDDKQMALVLAKPEAARTPLWLSFASNEMRVFGEFSTITKRIGDMPADLGQLIASIIMRINRDFDNDIIFHTLRLLQVADVGVPENEMYDVLGSVMFDEDEATSTSDQQQQQQLLDQDKRRVDRLTWSQIVLALKPFISFYPLENSSVIKLVHKRIRDIINDALFVNGQVSPNEYHLRLIAHYRYRSLYRRYAVKRLCYHYRQAGDEWNRQFLDFLRTRESFIYLNPHERSRIFKEMRCRRITNTSGASIARMCTMCSHRADEKSNYIQYKQACFICGSYVGGGTHANLVTFCILHDNTRGIPNGMYKCFVCNMLLSLTNSVSHFLPITAEVCFHCTGGGYCCALNI